MLFGLFFMQTVAAKLYPPVHHNWTRTEAMDPHRLYNLQWHVSEKEIHFKATVNTRGYIALGFIYQGVKATAFDLALTWVDDRSGKTNILVSKKCFRFRIRL